MVLTNYQCWALGAQQQLENEFDVTGQHRQAIDPFNPQSFFQHHQQLQQVSSNAVVTHTSSNGYYGYAPNRSDPMTSHETIMSNDNNNDADNNINGNNVTATKSNANLCQNNDINNNNTNNAANSSVYVDVNEFRRKKRYHVVDYENFGCAPNKRNRMDHDEPAIYCGDFFSSLSQQQHQQNFDMDIDESNSLQQDQQQQQQQLQQQPENYISGNNDHASSNGQQLSQQKSPYQGHNRSSRDTLDSSLLMSNFWQFNDINNTKNNNNIDEFCDNNNNNNNTDFLDSDDYSDINKISTNLHFDEMAIMFAIVHGGSSYHFMSNVSNDI